MVLCKLEKRNYGGKWPVSMKYQNLTLTSQKLKIKKKWKKLANSESPGVLAGFWSWNFQDSRGVPTASTIKLASYISICSVKYSVLINSILEFTPPKQAIALRIFRKISETGFPGWGCLHYYHQKWKKVLHSPDYLDSSGLYLPLHIMCLPTLSLTIF